MHRRDDATDLSPLFSRAPTVYHAELTPFPPRRTLSKAYSPVTEVVTLYFSLDLAKASQDKIASDTRKFRDILAGPGGCNASAGGWVLEEVSIPGQEERGKAFIMMMGWDSVDAHNEFIKTPVVQEHEYLIMDIVGRISLNMCHVSLTEVENSSIANRE